MIDTKQKILDTAERLIANQGYSATSLRHIISEAGVNLAAVHYHFGSKDDLLDEIILRKAEPVNRERLARFDRLEQEAGDGPLEVAKILEAFLIPMAEAADRTPSFVPFMGRLIAEGLIGSIVQRHFQVVTGRLVAALQRAVPGIPPDEFAWRMHFMSGAMAHAMCGSAHLPLWGAPESDFRGRVNRLVTFLSAGFNAPPTNEDK